MIDNSSLFHELLEKSKGYNSSIKKTHILLFVYPLIYFLLKFSIVDEIEMNLFNLKQTDLLIELSPLIYSLIYFYLTILIEHHNDILISIEKFEFRTDSISKNDFIKYLKPFNLIGEVIGNVRSGGTIGCLGTFFVFFPFLISTILIPVIFYFYSIIHNLNNNFNFFSVSFVSSFLSIWIVISAFIHKKNKSYK